MKTSMIKIGITGGIGCGKSLVSKFLEEEGIPIINADQIAKDIVNHNDEVKSNLITEFGADIYNANGILDRKKMATMVFGNKEFLQKLNAIIHPYVIKQQEAELAKIEKNGKIRVAGVEAALIYEAGIENRFDFIIVVSAPQKIVYQRLRDRDHLTSAQIAARIRSQMPLTEKVKRADFVIKNNGSIEDLRKKVKKLAQTLLEKFPDIA